MKIVPHPFQTWREAVPLDREQIVALLKARGRETSAAYIQQIELGHARVSGQMACDLADLTGGKVTERQFLRFERVPDGDDADAAGGEAA